MNIGGVAVGARVFLAPMAGITDRPFRAVCKRLGTLYAVGEMLTSNTRLWHTAKSSARLSFAGEAGPLVLQIAGADPVDMAAAARGCVEAGAQIVDINMGCPVKKVVNRWAGSALMGQLPLAARILEAVVAACAPHKVPVTLKMRTGMSASERNAVELARIAQDCGVHLVTVHGRTRDQRYHGVAEYHTVGEVKAAVRIPVVANGDIASPEQAQAVLQQTGVDAVMIGRAAQGRPWLPGQVEQFLAGSADAHPSLPSRVVAQEILRHQQDHLDHYGPDQGVKSFRKHIRWYLGHLPGGAAFCDQVNGLDQAQQQVQRLSEYLDALVARYDSWPDAIGPSADEGAECATIPEA